MTTGRNKSLSFDLIADIEYMRVWLNKSAFISSMEDHNLESINKIKSAKVKCIVQTCHWQKEFIGPIDLRYYKIAIDICIKSMIHTGAHLSVLYGCIKLYARDGTDKQCWSLSEHEEPQTFTRAIESLTRPISPRDVLIAADLAYS
jgi:hypothetical protein